MHYKGENHWKKFSLTAGLREIVNNRELCICIIFRETKAAKPGEKRSKSVVPEGRQGRGSRMQSSGSLVQEKASGRGSQLLQSLPPTAGVAAWSQAPLGALWAAEGALQGWGISPQTAWASSGMLHSHILHQLSPSWQISRRKCLQQIKPLKGNHKY